MLSRPEKVPLLLKAKELAFFGSFFGLAMLFFKIIERTIGNRVLVEVEWSGLDALEMGSDAYPHS